MTERARYAYQMPENRWYAVPAIGLCLLMLPIFVADFDAHWAAGDGLHCVLDVAVESNIAWWAGHVGWWVVTHWREAGSLTVTHWTLDWFAPDGTLAIEIALTDEQATALRQAFPEWDGVGCQPIQMVLGEWRG